MAETFVRSASFCQSAALSETGDGEYTQQLTQQPAIRSHSSGDPGRMVSASSMISMRYSRDMNQMSVPQSRDLSHELMSAGHSPLTHDSGFLADGPDPSEATASRLMSRASIPATAPVVGASETLRQRGQGARQEAASVLASHALDPSQFPTTRENTEASMVSGSVPQEGSIAAFRQNLTSEFCSPSGPTSVSSSQNALGMHHYEMPPHRSQAVRAASGTYTDTVPLELSERDRVLLRHLHTAPFLQHSFERMRGSATTPAPSLTTPTPSLASAQHTQSHSSAIVLQSRDFECLEMASEVSGSLSQAPPSLVTLPSTTVPDSQPHVTQQQAPGLISSGRGSLRAMPARSQVLDLTTIAVGGQPHGSAVYTAASNQAPRSAIPPPPLPCVRTRPQARTPSPVLPPRRAADRATGSRVVPGSHDTGAHNGHHAASTATAADAQKKHRQDTAGYGQDTSGPFQVERSSRSHCRRGAPATPLSPRAHIRRSPAPSPPVRPRWDLAFSSPPAPPSYHAQCPVQTKTSTASASSSSASRYNTPRSSLPSARRSTSCSPSSTPSSDVRSPTKPGMPGPQVPAGTYTPRTYRSFRGAQHTAPGSSTFGSAAHRVHASRVSTPRSPRKGGSAASQTSPAPVLSLPRCSSEGPEALAEHMTASSAAKRTPRHNIGPGKSYSSSRGHSVPRNMARGQSVPRHTPRDQPVRPLWGAGSGVQRTSGVKSARARVPGASEIEPQGTAEARGNFSIIPGTFRAPKDGIAPELSDATIRQHSITPTSSAQIVGKHLEMQPRGSTGTFSYPVDSSAQDSSRELRTARQHWYDANFGDWEKPSRRSTAELGAAAEGSFLSRCSTANSAFSATSSSSGWPWPGYATGSGEPVPAPTEQYSASFRHHAAWGPPVSDHGDASGVVDMQRSFSEIRNKFHVASVKEAAAAHEANTRGSLAGRRTVSAPSNAAHALLESLSSASSTTRLVDSKQHADGLAAQWEEQAWHHLSRSSFTSIGVEHGTGTRDRTRGATEDVPRPHWMVSKHRGVGSELLPPNVEGRLGRRSRRDRQKHILYVLPNFHEIPPNTGQHTNQADGLDAEESAGHKERSEHMQASHSSDGTDSKTERPLGLPQHCLPFLSAARRRQYPLQSVPDCKSGEELTDMNGLQPSQQSRNTPCKHSASDAGQDGPETRVVRQRYGSGCKHSTWSSMKSCLAVCHMRGCTPNKKSSRSKFETGQEQQPGTLKGPGVGSRSGAHSVPLSGSHTASSVEVTVASGDPKGPRERHVGTEKQFAPAGNSQGESSHRSSSLLFEAASKAKKDSLDKAFDILLNSGLYDEGGHSENPRPQKPALSVSHESLLHIQTSCRKRSDSPRTAARETSPGVDTASSDEARSVDHYSLFSPGLSLSSDCKLPVHPTGGEKGDDEQSKNNAYPTQVLGRHTVAQGSSPLSMTAATFTSRAVVQYNHPHSEEAERGANSPTLPEQGGAEGAEEIAQGGSIDYEHFDSQFICASTPCTHREHSRHGWPGALWSALQYLTHPRPRPSFSEAGEGSTEADETQTQHLSPLGNTLTAEQTISLVEAPETDGMQTTPEDRHILAPGIELQLPGRHDWITNDAYSAENSLVQSPLPHRISLSSQVSGAVELSACPSPAHDLQQEQSIMTEAAATGPNQDAAADLSPVSPVPASPCHSPSASSVSSAPESTHARLRAALGCPGPGGTRIPPSVPTTPRSSISDAISMPRVLSTEAITPQEPGAWYTINSNNQDSVGHSHEAESIDPAAHGSPRSAVLAPQRSEIRPDGAIGEGLEQEHMSGGLDDMLHHMRQPAAQFARSRLRNVREERRIDGNGSHMDSRVRLEGTGTSQGSAHAANDSNEELEDVARSWRQLASIGLGRGGVAALRATSVALYGRAISIVKRRQICRVVLGSGRLDTVRNADGSMQLTDHLSAEGADWEGYEASIRQRKALQIVQGHWSTMGMPACCATSHESLSEFVQFSLKQHQLTTSDSVSLKLLNAAALLQRPSMAIEMIQEGYDVSQTDWRGQSALHHAASLNNSQVLRALIDAGAEVDCTDKTGSSPLHIAVLFKATNCISCLLHRGADKFLPNLELRTPWALAFSSGSTAVHSAFVNAMGMADRHTR